MRYRTPNQLHASLYMEENVTTDKRRNGTGVRKNAKTARVLKTTNIKSGGKKK